MTRLRSGAAAALATWRGGSVQTLEPVKKPMASTGERAATAGIGTNRYDIGGSAQARAQITTAFFGISRLLVSCDRTSIPGMVCVLTPD